MICSRLNPQQITCTFLSSCKFNASEKITKVQVHVNDLNSTEPVFDTLQFGWENAIARHGIHGLYKLWTIGVDSKLLRVGQNIFFLTQRVTYGGPFIGTMYDYLRLEALLY
jgi:rhamnogalacturonan endolyase